MKVGFDCDGVLFSFTRAYTRKLEEVSGKKCTLPLGAEPDCWHWATKYGFTKEDDNKAWESIKQDPTFWAMLPPTLEAPQACDVLNKMYLSGHEVYFITNRPGVATHAQTMVALRLLGIELPQVLVSEDKGPLVKGLKLDFFIDDKPSNCEEAAAHTLPMVRSWDDKYVPETNKPPTCRVFCFDANYNRKHEFNPAYNIQRTKTLREFFEAMAFEEVNQ